MKSLTLLTGCSGLQMCMTISKQKTAEVTVIATLAALASFLQTIFSERMKIRRLGHDISEKYSSSPTISWTFHRAFRTHSDPFTSYSPPLFDAAVRLFHKLDKQHAKDAGHTIDWASVKRIISQENHWLSHKILLGHKHPYSATGSEP